MKVQAKQDAPMGKSSIDIELTEDEVTKLIGDGVLVEGDQFFVVTLRIKEGDHEGS